jgi:hypothetical protein
MIAKQQLGFEAFMDSATEGWSLVAIRGPIERLEQVLRQRAEVLAYETDVPPEPLAGNPVLKQEVNCRRGFAIQLADSPWSVLLRTVDWITPYDAIAVRKMAALLSRESGATTMASIGAYDGAECRLFRHAMEVARIDTDDPYLDLLEFCEEQEFNLPGCFIGFNGHAATLYLEDVAADAIHRCDRVVLR